MRVFRKLILLSLSLISAAILYACSNSEDNITRDATPEELTYVINFIPAKTNAELVLLRSEDNNMIKSLAHLTELLLEKSTPLSKLDPILLKDFLDGIVFKKGVGIVGLKYNSLQANVDPKTYNSIMAMFGIDTAGGFWGGAGMSPEGRSAATTEGKLSYFCQISGNCLFDPCCICLAGCMP